jgi:hypothetical protein
MSDKTIINAISKLHFIIISIIFFIFLTLSSTFILLQNGVHLKNISLPNIQARELYIKWNEKLNIKIKEIKINSSKNKKTNNFNLKQANKLFKSIKLFNEWFEQIDIQEVTFNDINASFKYAYGGDGYINLNSKDITLKASLYFESNIFVTKVKSFHNNKFNVDADGYIFFDMQKQIKLISSLNINANNDAKLKIYLDADMKKLRYKIVQKENIKSIDHIMQNIPMPKEVRYWAYEAIKVSDIKLKYAYGYVDYDKPEEALTNIRVLADANKLQYTYNKKLEPVVTKYTELEFKDGILFIRPKGAYQYGFYLNKSWLKIDFAKKEELLTLFLLFKGKVNKDLLYLLDTYKIKLPFLQNSGDVDTNLKITVNLRTIAVNAKGDFFTKKSNFHYLGLDIDIFNAKIYLDNYDVSIKNMLSKYKDIATADVDVKFNAKKNEGFIDFRFKDIKFDDFDLKLKQKTPLYARYTISNKQDTIKAKDSSWIYAKKKIHISKLNIPFTLKTLTAKLPITKIAIKNQLKATIFGKISLKPLKTDLKLNLFKLDINNIKMTQKSNSFHIKYDKKLTITSTKKTNFDIENFKCAIDKINLNLQGDILNIKPNTLKIKDLATIKFDTKYNLKNNQGKINIKKVNINTKDINGIFNSTDNIALDIKSKKNSITIESKQLGIKYVTNTLQNQWKFNSNSLKKLYSYSTLLKDYNITNGQLSIYKEKHNKKDTISFVANINYPYKILVEDNTPLSNYTIEGKFNQKTKNIALKLNSDIDINIDKNITIKSKNTGISINEVLRYIKDTKKDNSKDEKIKNIIFRAKNSYIYITQNRHILYDTFNLTYKNNILNANFNHKNGNAKLKIENHTVYLYGNGFNDEFMDRLFALSRFKGGSLSFLLSGTLEEYDTLIQIKDTTIQDYKILNNILAFVNTVPSLMTFSVPGYSKYGLEVKNAYASVHTKDDIFYINNFYMDSKELDILGKGTASFKTNQLNLELNLKTDIGSSISKIPIVGYILLGDDTVSTSMKITGKLDDPKIESMIAKDIAVAPLNILKRTLKSPFQMFKKKR